MLALFFVLILLGIVAFAVMVAADITIPEEEVFALLSHWQWKSGLEIKAEYRQKKKVPEWRSVGGTLYTALYRLEREGWVEVRERELSSEQFARRGNRPQLEYRLTSSGTRRRHESDLCESIDPLGNAVPLES